jgi:hypothetical protein
MLLWWKPRKPRTWSLVCFSSMTLLQLCYLSKCKALIKCAKKYVELTTPDGKEMEFVTEPVVTAKGVANHANVNQLNASQGSEVPVVNEFSDVFPKELPGMPPD